MNSRFLHKFLYCNEGVQSSREDRCEVEFGCIDAAVWSRWELARQKGGRDKSHVPEAADIPARPSPSAHSFSILLTSPPACFQISLHPPPRYKLAAEHTPSQQHPKQGASSCEDQGRRPFPGSTQQTFPTICPTGQAGSPPHPQTPELEAFHFPRVFTLSSAFCADR